MSSCKCSQLFFREFASKMTKKALVFLAPGAEEMEFVISVDVLRRAGIEVSVAGLNEDNNTVKCSRSVNIVADIPISEAKIRAPFDLIVLPGGLGGSNALAESKEVGDLLRDQENCGRLIGAICAAPVALKSHKIGLGKNITAYPAMENQLDKDYKYKEDDVVVDGTLVTSRGPGTAFAFALALVEKLEGKEKAQEVAKAMLVSIN